MENLWGEIPSNERKPSGGYTNASQLSMSSNQKGGGNAAPMPKMMDKEDKKKRRKKK